MSWTIGICEARSSMQRKYSWSWLVLRKMFPILKRYFPGQIQGSLWSGPCTNALPRNIPPSTLFSHFSIVEHVPRSITDQLATRESSACHPSLCSANYFILVLPLPMISFHPPGPGFQSLSDWIDPRSIKRALSFILKTQCFLCKPVLQRERVLFLTIPRVLAQIRTDKSGIFQNDNDVVAMVDFQWGCTSLTSGRTRNGIVEVPNAIVMRFPEDSV